MSLKKIAKELGISVTTVSRAINGYSDVAQETRQKVLDAAQKMGYQPNMMARRLKMGKIDSVGLLLPAQSLHGDNTMLLEIVAETSHHLAKQDIDLLLISDDDNEQSDMLLRTIQSRKVNALIVAHTRPQDSRLELLQHYNFPFVAMGRSQLAKPYAWFDFDNQQGTWLATRHLIAQGHTRIALLCNDSPQTFAIQRKQGYLQALQESGMKADSSLILALPNSRRRSYEATLQLLQQSNAPTAIVTTDSLFGEGAALALQEQKLLPHGIALIAYDGLPPDSIITQDVSSITQATSQEVGQQIASMMLSLLQGEKPENLQVLWQPQLHLGETSGHPLLQG
ncbi:LacI family DNA-binding transcriptional regulator [Celerinatantimonas sp. YJH-8]|uniref:LacI family DNA-binding transcriptional regulator n=1 Tax=Celerinatantimonas sp. YJH-8 TaxID=3228714 RepID=UPI0038C9EA65